MALTTEQVFALGILYNKLATIVYGNVRRNVISRL